MNDIEIIADISAILTAIVAVVGYSCFVIDRYVKQCKLEKYLKNEKQDGDKGQRSLLHLMAKLGMTEPELLQASFRSKYIVRRVGVDKETKRADVLLLEYKD